MTREFNNEEIRLVANLEKRMDDGEVQFVLWAGSRVAVEDHIMRQLGLTHGQSISGTIFQAIINARIQYCNQIIEAEKNIQ